MLPPLLNEDDTIDSSSGAECWSDIEKVQHKYLRKKDNKCKKSNAVKKRCSVAVRNSTHMITKKGCVNRKRKTNISRMTENNAAAHTAMRKFEEVEKLETALSILQSKFIDQIESNKKLQQSLTDALNEERARCNKLEKELITQKNCIDLILQETTNERKHTVEITKKAVFEESKDMKSQIKSHKSDLTVQVTRIENHFEDIETKIASLQSAMDNTKNKHSHQIEETKQLQSLMMKRLEGTEEKISADNDNRKPTTSNHTGATTDVKRSGNGRLQKVPGMANKTHTTPEVNGTKSYALAVQTAKNEVTPSTNLSDSVPSSAERGTYRRKGHDQVKKNPSRRSTTSNHGAVSDYGNNHVGTKKGYRPSSKRKCLLIHDSTFEDFHQEKFSKQLNVTPFSAKKASIAVKSKKLQDLIKSENPDCIYIHLGLHDIIGGDVDSTLCSFEELVELMLDSTAATICLSLVVPTSNNAPLNKKINELNEELNLMVTTLRSDQENLRERLFTYNNSSVAWLNKKLPQGVLLTERGKLVMWTKLKDGLRKTLRLPRPNLNNPNSPNRQNNSRNE